MKEETKRKIMLTIFLSDIAIMLVSLLCLSIFIVFYGVDVIKESSVFGWVFLGFYITMFIGFLCVDKLKVIKEVEK